MRLLLAYLRLHSATVRLLSAAALTALALGALLSLHTATGNAIPLGDANAERRDMVSQPILTTASPQARPIAAARLADARGVTADLQPSEAHLPPLMAALNCARTQSGQPAIGEDAALSKDAAALWRTMVERPDLSPASIIGSRYAFVAIVPLSLAAVQPADTAAAEAPVALCSFGGMDLSALDLAGLTTVGAAVFLDPQPEDGLDDSSAIIVAK